MELTKDETADGAHLCPGYGGGNLVCSCLSFSSGCCCLSPYIIPHSCSPSSKRSLGERGVCIQVCLRVCACGMCLLSSLETQPSWEACRVQYSWTRLCVFTWISHAEAPPSSWLIPTWFSRPGSYVGRPGLWPR